MISLFVGLGNIGKRYVNTRHNLGFDVVDLAIEKIKAKALPSEFFYHIFGTRVDGHKVTFAKPTTMMNGSGGAVLALLDNLNLTPSEMLVVCDDFNIPLGSIRIRTGGSHGGHNGLESIIEALQTEDFPRLRLGIGPVVTSKSDSKFTDPTASRGRPKSEKTSGGRPTDVEIVDFVLGKFSENEAKTAKKMIETAAEAVIFAAGHRLEVTMSKYNFNPA